MPEKASKNLERDELGRLLPGQRSLNPAGKPKGHLSFATKWRKAIEKIADSSDITADEVEEQLIKVGIKKAREGDYSFYRDTFDRVYGKPQQSLDVTTQGEKVIDETRLPESVIQAALEANRKKYEQAGTGQETTS